MTSPDRFLPARCAVAVALAGLAAPVAVQAAQEAAGQVVFAVGTAWRVGPDGLREPLQAGMAVRAGDQIATGPDTHVHLRMSDNAFVAVRPQSQLNVSVYQYDPAAPAASRIRLDLVHGNTRAVSGKGGEAAKQNYRFNTPIAAIGLRGTDYTVLSSEDVTRVSVARGAVSVSPLGDGCLATALGPCATPATRELSADLAHAYLEINSRQRTPMLVKPEQDPHGGAGQNAPARAEEPRADNGKDAAKPGESRGGGTAVAGSTSVKDAANLVTADRLIVSAADVQVTPPAPQRPQMLQWGRWAGLALAPGAASPMVVSLLGEGREITVANELFGLVRTIDPTPLPSAGAFGFQLAGSEAYARAADGGAMGAAQVRRGTFDIDFTQRTFGTTLSVAHDKGSEQLYAAGRVQFQGYLVANPAQSNMNLSGIVAGGGNEAAYLFDKTLASGGSLLGAVRWIR